MRMRMLFIHHSSRFVDAIGSKQAACEGSCRWCCFYHHKGLAATRARAKNLNLHLVVMIPDYSNTVLQFGQSWALLVRVLYLMSVHCVKAG